MTKVLLVNPPFYRVQGSHYNGISLGISYIASVLNAAGHDAWVYNADFEKIDKYKLLYDVYTDFLDFIEIFKDEEHFIWKETAKAIAEFDPDWVGWTSYTANISAIQILSKHVRNLLPNARQVVGGVHATLDPTILKTLPDVDYAVQREGECAMLDLVNNKKPNEVRGVSYRTHVGDVKTNGQTLPIKPLDILPYPERNKFWHHEGRPATSDEKLFMDVSYMTSVRGCPYRCTFCASPAIWGRDKTQYRTPVNMVNEIEHVIDQYWNPDSDVVDYSLLSQHGRDKGDIIKEAVRIKDNSVVYFVDDIFTIRKKRSIAIMQELIDRNLKVPWKCESRADKIDQELADKMAESHCVRVKIGVESGSDRVLKQMQKDETKDDIRRGIKCLKAAGVAVTIHLLTGFTGETDDDLQQTIDFALELEPDYCSMSILSPYFGTQVYRDALDQGISLDKQPWEYFFHHSKTMMVNNTLSAPQIEKFWELCNLSRYV